MLRNVELTSGEQLRLFIPERGAHVEGVHFSGVGPYRLRVAHPRSWRHKWLRTNAEHSVGGRTPACLPRASLGAAAFATYPVATDQRKLRRSRDDTRIGRHLRPAMEMPRRPTSSPPARLICEASRADRLLGKQLPSKAVLQAYPDLSVMARHAIRRASSGASARPVQAGTGVASPITKGY